MWCLRLCLLLLVLGLSHPGVSHAQATAVHRTSSANVSGNSTYLDLSGANGNPNALLWVTPNSTVAGASRANIGVWYDTGRGRWAIFNEDRGRMGAGLVFNVLLLPPGDDAFVVRRTPGAPNPEAVVVDRSTLSGTPESVVIATHNWNPPGVPGTYNNNPITAFWTGSRWAIANQKESPSDTIARTMVDNTSFNVAIFSPGPRTFVHRATPANLIFGTTVLNQPELNGNPDAVIIVTPAFNPDGGAGTWSRRPLAVNYDTGLARWVIAHPGFAVPAGAAFNVYVGEGRRTALGDVLMSDLSPQHSNRFGTDGVTRGTSSAAGRIISLAVSPDGRRVYAGTMRGGLWRSDDGGVRWRQLTRPQPGGAIPVCPPGRPAPCGLPMVTIADVAVAPFNPDLVFAATAMDPRMPERHGVYRSEDGGETWAMVHSFVCALGGGRSFPQAVSQIVFAPDDPTRLWAAGGCGVAFSALDGTPDGARPTLPADALRRVGQAGTWTTVGSPAGAVWHVAVASRDAVGRRRTYACGNGVLLYSSDGGRRWVSDPQAAAQVGGNCGPPSNQAGGFATPAVIAVDPTSPERVYVAVSTGSNGQIFFGQEAGIADGTECAGASVGCFVGGLLSVTVSGDPPSFAWRREAGPPALYGTGSISGAVSLISLPSEQGGFTLLFADKNSLYVTTGPPTPDGWFRLDAPPVSVQCRSGASTPTCNKDNARPHDAEGSIHMDPHAIAVTPGFRITLTPPPASVPEPYRVTRERSGCATGQTLVLGTDGGTYSTSDCGASWLRAENLRTLDTHELAIIPRPGSMPALYFGMPDNDSLYSLDGGARWRVGDICGDCTGYWVDPAVPDLIFLFDRWDYGYTLTSWSSSNGAAPDIRHSTSVHKTYPAPAGVLLGESIHGARPMVYTLESEPPVLDGDMVIAATASSATYVWRLRDGRWQREGPPLPEALPGAVVQASGGHRAPVYYVADLADNARNTEPNRLWRLRRDGSGRSVGWDCIVPGPANPGVADGLCRPAPMSGAPGAETCAPGQVCRAFNFSSNPYDPNVVYISDWDGIKLSTDGGSSWRIEPNLTRLLSAGGAIPAPCRWMCNGMESVQRFSGMTFVRNEPRTRFAVGAAGVFLSVDGATANGETETWHRLLDTDSLACIAGPPAFDQVGNPRRTLYVPCSGRSLLRFSGIPGPLDAAALRSQGLRVTDLIELNPLRIETAPVKPDKPPTDRLRSDDKEEQPKKNFGSTPLYPPPGR